MTLFNNILNDNKYKNIIEKFLSYYLKKDISLSKYNNNKYTDKDIVDELKELNDEKYDLYSTENNYKRGLRRWNYIRDTLKNNKHPVKKYLDFGGGSGDMAYAIGNQMRLTKENIFVVDKKEFGGTTWIPNKKITFYDNINNIKSNSIDLITCFHVLHHIDNIDDIINEFYRVLKPDGILIILEHDVDNQLLTNYIDIEHLIFDTIINKNISYDDYIKTYFSKFYSKNDLIKIFNKFKFINYTNINKPDNSAYFTFKK